MPELSAKVSAQRREGAAERKCNASVLGESLESKVADTRFESMISIQFIRIHPKSDLRSKRYMSRRERQLLDPVLLLRVTHFAQYRGQEWFDFCGVPHGDLCRRKMPPLLVDQLSAPLTHDESPLETRERERERKKNRKAQDMDDATSQVTLDLNRAFIFILKLQRSRGSSEIQQSADWLRSASGM